MEGPTYVTLSAQLALQSQLNITANNVANANTAGYKADRQLFQSLVEPLDGPGQSVSYVQDRATYIDREAGPMQATDNPLDVAVQGSGYLAVRTRQGTQYSRDGRMQIAQDGSLVDAAGNTVLGQDGNPVLIPQGSTNIKISGDGTINVHANGTNQDIGQIGLFRSGNPVGLRKSGLGLVDGAAGAMRPVDPGDTSTRIVQGAVEGSTVQPVKELANMTELSRAYERLSQLISDDDNRESKMIDELGKTN